MRYGIDARNGMQICAMGMVVYMNFRRVAFYNRIHEIRILP